MKPPSVGCDYMKLEFIPTDFPAYVQEIRFMGNSVTALNRTHTFPGHLTNVTKIMMYDGFSSLDTVGSDSFAMLTSLRSLDLHGNSIRMIEMYAFRGPRRLEELILYDNSLTSLTQRCFASFDAILLDLSRNQLVDMDATAFENSTVTQLLLGFNKISSLKRSNFVELKDSLKTIDISDNRVDLTIEPETFSDLSLDNLLMRKSRISTTSGGFTSWCSVLQTLDLSDNTQTTFNLTSMTNLTTLLMARSAMSDMNSLPSPNRNLERLDLSENRLKSAGSEYLFDIRKLYGYSSLKELTLSRNLLKEIPILTINELPALQTLNLDGNEISEIDDITIANYVNNRSMKTINLMGNKIQTVSRSIEKYIGLVNLVLSANPFHCNCEMEWFRKWAIVHASSVEMNYQCETPHVRKMDCRVLTNWPSCEFNCTLPSIVDFTSFSLPGEGVYILIKVKGDPAPDIRLIDLADPENVVEVRSRGDKSIEFNELSTNLRTEGGMFLATVSSVAGIINRTECFTGNGTYCDINDTTTLSTKVVDFTEVTTDIGFTNSPNVRESTDVTYERESTDVTKEKPSTDILNVTKEKLSTDVLNVTKEASDVTVSSTTGHDTTAVQQHSTDNNNTTATTSKSKPTTLAASKTTIVPVDVTIDNLTLALIIAGVALIILIIIVMICFLCREKKRRRLRKNHDFGEKSNDGCHVNRAFRVPNDIDRHSVDSASIYKTGFDLTPAVSTDMIIGTDFLDDFDITNRIAGCCDQETIRPLNESDREKQKFTDLSRISDIDETSERSYNRAATLTLREPVSSDSYPIDYDSQSDANQSEDLAAEFNHSCASSIHSNISPRHHKEAESALPSPLSLRSNSQSPHYDLGDNEAMVLKAIDDALLHHMDDSEEPDAIPFHSNGNKWGENRSNH